MKTDLYTKIILTIIAIGLVVIIVRDIDFVQKATAQDSYNRATLDVNIVSVNGTKLYNGLDVNVKNKVEIEAPYGGLDVNVKNDVDVNIPYRLDVYVTNK